MSTQEEKLKAIADAIREKDGTTTPIVANDFPARIRAIETGGKLPEDMCMITVSSNDEEGGTVSGGGAVQKGMTVVVTANPLESGYNFIGWYEGDQMLSNEPKYSFEVDGSKNLIGSFMYGSRLPRGYTELEYITTQVGTSILTDVEINTSTAKVLCDIEPIEKATTYNAVILNSVPTTIYVGSSAFYLANKSSTMIWYAGIFSGSSDINGGTFTYNLAKDIRINVEVDFPNKAVKMGPNSFEFSPDATKNVALRYGWVYNNTNLGGLKMKIYSGQAYVDGELKGDFVPCKNSKGKVGLYNLITGAFCTNNSNASSSEPIAGPSI